jgi:cell shape-determining protein MreD
MKIIITLLFFLALLLESTVIHLPLILILLLILFVNNKSYNVFILAFFLGLLLDIMTVQRLGTSSLFFLVFLFLVYLYDRKYRIKTLPFVSIAAGIAAFLYTWIITNNISLIGILISTIISAATFLLYKIL